MAKYRWLEAGFGPDACRYEAGQVVELPDTWRPNGSVEPLDAEAAQAFFNAGPQLTPLVRQQWENLLVTRGPATYWKPVDAAKETWELTGLGRGLGTRRWVSNADRLNSLP
jgi:hypothetical protein